ncbi:MAG: D-2-hydroxyacid dehydrogenase [Actinocatenispora sp.]
MESVEKRADVRYVGADQLPEALLDTDVLFVWDFLSDVVPASWPTGEHRVRWVHIASAGVNNVLFPELRDADVVLTNSRGVFDQPVAEYVLGMVLAFVKDLTGTVHAQREHRWQHRETERLAERTALVVGTGPIGRATARLLRAVGLQVRAIGRTARSQDPDFGAVHPFEELTDQLGWADFVIVVAPLTPQTTGMINADTLRAMRPSARLINVGRGAQVVTDDLVEALRDRTIAGAALDVLETEPLAASSPLWTMPDVLISPHMAGDVVGWRSALVDAFTSNFLRWREGSPLRNVVDAQLGYVPTGSTVD